MYMYAKRFINKVSRSDALVVVSILCSVIFQLHNKLHIHFKISGEEDISPGIEASKTAILKYKNVDNLWIVDPIDGITKNFTSVYICMYV